VQSAPAVRMAFYILAAALPALLVSATLSGVLEGMQRFDLANSVKVPAGCASLVLPVIVLWAGGGLVGVVASVVAARVGALVAYAVIVRQLTQNDTSMQMDSRSIKTSRKLLGFGGWIAVSAIISPLMVQM